MSDDWKPYQIVIEFDCPSDAMAEIISDVISTMIFNSCELDDCTLDLNAFILRYMSNIMDKRREDVVVDFTKEEQ